MADHPPAGPGAGSGDLGRAREVGGDLPDPAGAVLLTIDMQRDFALPGAPLEVPGTLVAVERAAAVAAAFRAAGRPIVHAVRLYAPDGSDAEPSRRDLVRRGGGVVAPGSDGAELVDGLAPDPAVRLDAPALRSGRLQELGSVEWAMYKPRWRAFYATALAGHLAALGATTVVVCGCNFPNCPRTTVYEASERDLEVVLVADATSGVYVRGLDELRAIGVRTLAAADCCRWVAATGAGAR